MPKRSNWQIPSTKGIRLWHWQNASSLSRRKRRARRQRRELHRFARRGRPRRSRQTLQRRRRGRIDLPRHHRLIRQPGYHLHIIEEVAGQVFIPLTVGGGVRTVADIRRLLNAGADKVSINTAAVTRPDLIDEAAGFFGSQAIVAAVDAKAVNPENTRWEIFTHGGRNPTGLDAVEWAIEMQKRGAGEILLTGMDRDGTKQGFNLPLTRAVAEAVDIPVIASGGVGNVLA